MSKRFGDFTAVDDVSFEIRSGEIFGFLGSNGSGKTTTMKMLTGLLEPTSGKVRLFGQPLESSDLETRRRVGYVSQSFSLYGELTVRQNLRLHAQIFQLPPDEREPRVEDLLDRFDLGDVAETRPKSLPLGIRQRLQLAVAILHRPDILILDEPTSGVDPVARDSFWQTLIELSEDDGVTIFISTHYAYEAERCDRISLMHEGRVLAIGTPRELQQQRSAETIEDAFVGYLEEVAGEESGGNGAHAPPAGEDAADHDPRRRWLDPAMVWAFARRETLELVRDPIRIAFALLGPVVLMLSMGYGISFDVQNLRYAALDQDRTSESRSLIAALEGSRYFAGEPPATGPRDLRRRLAGGEIGLALVIPPRFGRDLMAGRRPEVAAWIDGSDTARAETARGYVQGVFAGFLAEIRQRQTGLAPAPFGFEPRFRYNQAFESAQAIPPGVLMMMLIMIPTMLTALGVVREKEHGSIANFYAAPVRRIEFLLGKQLPYIAVAMASGALLVALMLTVFGLVLKGSPVALVLGALLFTTAATAFGLVVSSFVRSQIAAVFASAIIVMIPTLNFSGMLYPVSTLEGPARVVGQAFPALYFQRISAGVFNKGMGVAELAPNFLALGLFCVVFWAAAALLLGRQEA